MDLATHLTPGNSQSQTGYFTEDIMAQMGIEIVYMSIFQKSKPKQQFK